jgi:GMP synthase-like glutamine amidotransferase
MHFLVFQHVDVEHPGIFRDYWRQDGIEWTSIELDEGESIPEDLSRYDALVVMGGPMDVWQLDAHPWLVPEIAAIRRFVVDLRRPFLGVCLGHQLLAAALGANVATASAPEVGPCPVELTGEGKTDALFEGLESPLLTFQWHSSEVVALPAGAVALARTKCCRIQAMRWADHAYGLQFHAELTPTTVEEWGRIPAYQQSLIEALGAGRAQTLARDTALLLPGFAETARILNRNFMRLITG